MSGPEGFTYQRRANSDVVVFHHGKVATVLRGARAATFLAEMNDGADEQELLARLTGNYKRGNERLASQHPRNRGTRGRPGQ
ncbi:MAG: hypothetical protein KDB06_03860 [Ilumatobacter sp.]|nr:hypothetical protein [Ilumatobacter sp.]MCB0983767.1 hypothetical protein [Ilumatobacter sp.]MCO5328752.1 hypothetical protein [Ilumatobacteraceae bacterium]